MKSRLLVFVLFITSTAFGQIPGGTWFASGGIWLDNSKTVNPTPSQGGFVDLENTQTMFLLRLGAGFAFAENQAVGIGFGMDNSKSVNENFTGGGQVPTLQTTTTKNSSFSISPFYRYYYFCAEQFAIIGQVHIPIVFTGGETTMEYDDGTPTAVNERPNGLGFGGWVTPSFAWFPKNTWSVEASIGQIGFYSESYTDSNDNKNKTSDFGAKLWLFQPTISFTYYFRGSE